MAKTGFPKVSVPSESQIGRGGLNRTLADSGQSPPMAIIIKPLNGSKELILDRFLSYKFSSSILIPVDTFSFEYSAPDAPPLTDFIQDGDIASLMANGVQLSTGIIDTTETETDDDGEVSRLSGRDMMGQLEDQGAVTLTSTPIFANSISLQNGVKRICQDTKITKFDFRDLPRPPTPPLLASDPGESKLAVLQRFLEPYNVVAWTGPSGQLIVGKPNMSQTRKGSLVCSRSARFSNVLHARVTRSSTTIANMVAAIWTGQEVVQSRIPRHQIFDNDAPGPKRLRQAGYLVPKAVVVSNPNANDSQGLSDINKFTAGGSTVLQGYAKREIARENVGEIVFQCMVQGHYNDLGEPYMPDTVYFIEYDRGKLSEDMYLYEVSYELTPAGGQRTVLTFCRFGCIVADIRAPGA